MTPPKRHEFSLYSLGDFQIGIGICIEAKMFFISLGLVGYTFSWDIPNEV